MRVAALYDVHGMPWALEAVLAELDADVVVFGGDLVAGPLPRETWELASAVPNARFVRGNAERDPEAFVTASLDAALLAEMAAWPEHLELDGVYFCHATPRGDLDIVTDATSDDSLAEKLAGVAAPLVVGGHTHMQQRRGRYFNPGSVGMPYEGEVAAYWGMVVDGVPEFRRTPFDVGRAVAALEASGWPPAAEFAEENLRRAVSRAEAIEVFGG